MERWVTVTIVSFFEVNNVMPIRCNKKHLATKSQSRAGQNLKYNVSDDKIKRTKLKKN